MFEPLKAIDALNEHHVEYVVVGGWGTLQHGATRLTQDLDICPELSAENLERLAQALTDLQAQLQIAPDQTVPVPIIDGRLLSQMQIGNWSTHAGGLDILQHIPALDGRQLSYPELRHHATKVTDDGRVFAVASLADITASKRAAGRQKRTSRRYPSWSGSSPRVRHPETVMAPVPESRYWEKQDRPGDTDAFLLLADPKAPPANGHLCEPPLDQLETMRRLETTTRTARCIETTVKRLQRRQ